MKFFKSIAFSSIALLGFASKSQATDLVSICSTCTTPASFQNAAKAEIGRVGGAYEVLVVNPNTKVTMFFSILFNPGGGGGPMPQAMTVDAGQAISLSNHASTGVTAHQAELEVAAAAGPGDNWRVESWSASPQEAAEVGAIIDLTKTDQVIILPQNSEYFASFAGRNREATVMQINVALTEKNAGWAGSTLREGLNNSTSPGDNSATQRG